MVNMKVFQLVYRLGDMEFEEMKKPFINLPKIENWISEQINIITCRLYNVYKLYSIQI